MQIDLDHNATTPLDPRVRDAMIEALAHHGNPSSLHEAGRRARDAVERARAEVARLIRAHASDVVFTSGGTEADVLGVVGSARAARAAGKPARVIASPIEHPAVRGALAQLAAEGFEVAHARVDSRGRIDLDHATTELASGAALVVFALANHELGNVTDVSTLASRARERGAHVHCDAVQAVGKLLVDVEALGVDTLALSAHKLHGPKGVGALWIRRGVDVAPVLPGHQERGRRGGTENLAGAVGFGEAARICRAEGASTWGAQAALRDRLERGALAIEGARVHGDVGSRVPNTSNVGFDGAPGDVLCAALDLEGVACSTGAACTSGSVEPSHVLLALGLERARAAEAIRFSLGRETTVEEIDRVVELLPGLVARVRDAMSASGT